MNSNKKILISILAFILVVAAIIGVLLIVSNRTDKDETTEPAPVSTTAVATTEASSHVMPTTSPAMNNSQTLSQVSQIEAFISGHYYMSATMEEGGEITTMDIAMNGQDFQTTMDMAMTEDESMRASILYLGGCIYFVDVDSKTYVEFSKELMQSVGMDLTEIEDEMGEMNLSGYEFKGVDQTQTELNGYTADCYRYYTDDISVYFYFIGDEMKQIEIGDTDGSTMSTITIQEFSPTIPGNMLSLSGLKKSDLMSFFLSMAG